MEYGLKTTNQRQTPLSHGKTDSERINLAQGNNTKLRIYLALDSKSISTIIAHHDLVRKNVSGGR